MAQTRPHVSVILPTYNRAGGVGDSIRSVVNQTYSELELIVVDDGSTDETEAVVGGFDDPRIEYIRHDENQGVSGARNTGIEAANGEIIAFQDSDDEWLPEKLEKQIQVFDDAPETVGVVYTGMWRDVDGESRYLPYRDVEPKEGDITDSIVRLNFISTQMAAVRSECFETVGPFDENLAALVDWELWLRIAEQYRFRLVDEALVRGGVEADSISTSKPAIVAGREYILEKHADKFDTSSLANHLFFVGHGAMKTGQTGKGREYLGRALRTKFDPVYAGCWGLSMAGAQVYQTVYNQLKGD